MPICDKIVEIFKINLRSIPNILKVNLVSTCDMCFTAQKQASTKPALKILKIA